MDLFLENTIVKLNAENYCNLTIVLGNESCDLDSAVSSLVYATYLHWQHNTLKCKSCSRGLRDESTYKDELFVPVLNVDREDFNLKTEVAFCLREHSIDESKLIFRDDLNLKQLVASKPACIVLVDHHVLSKDDAYLSPYVTEIIDHRPRDHGNWPYKDSVRTTMDIVGSCCTLVSERVRNLANMVASDVDFFNTHPVTCDILHSTIILDTVNFSKDVKKATALDIEIVTYLESFVKPDDVEQFRICKLEKLVAARSDVSSLTASQLLKKDVKTSGSILVPSFPILVEEFLRKPDVQEAMDSALARNNCTLLLLLGMRLAGADVERDAAVYSSQEHSKQADGLSQVLEEWSSSSLGLMKTACVISGCRLYRQMNLSASRKQYVPAVRRFLELNDGIHV